MKLKPRTHYKIYNKTVYYIIYTGTRWVYVIAEHRNNKLLHRPNKKVKWGSIKQWQDFITQGHNKTEELSKNDLFLELL